MKRVWLHIPCPAKASELLSCGETRSLDLLHVENGDEQKEKVGWQGTTRNDRLLIYIEICANYHGNTFLNCKFSFAVS